MLLDDSKQELSMACNIRLRTRNKIAKGLSLRDEKP